MPAPTAALAAASSPSRRARRNASSEVVRPQGAAEAATEGVIDEFPDEQASREMSAATKRAAPKEPDVSKAGVTTGAEPTVSSLGAGCAFNPGVARNADAVFEAETITAALAAETAPEAGATSVSPAWDAVCRPAFLPGVAGAATAGCTVGATCPPVTMGSSARSSSTKSDSRVLTAAVRMPRRSERSI